MFTVSGHLLAEHVEGGTRLGHCVCDATNPIRGVLETNVATTNTTPAPIRGGRHRTGCHLHRAQLFPAILEKRTRHGQ